MGKKSRSERHRAQADRAIKTGDVDALRALAERNASAGAKSIIDFLNVPPGSATGTGGRAAPCAAGGSANGSVSPEIAALAARTSAKLRAEAAFDLALRLSGACSRCTPEIRLEEAIAAFAVGDDARVREIGAVDEAVARATAPLLAAVQGGRMPAVTQGSSPGRRALVECCRTVAAIVRKQPASVSAAMRQVPAGERPRFFVAELMTASRLSAARAQRLDGADVVSLARSAVVRRSERAMSSLAMTVARRLPMRVAEALFDRMDLSPEVKRDALLHATCAGAGLDAECARVSMVVAKLGAAAFPENERGAAALHEGYAFVRTSPSRARAAFDQAVALGADSRRGHARAMDDDEARTRWLAGGNARPPLGGDQAASLARS